MATLPFDTEFALRLWLHCCGCLSRFHAGRMVRQLLSSRVQPMLWVRYGPATFRRLPKTRTRLTQALSKENAD
jgi:hypothetical protein